MSNIINLLVVQNDILSNFMNCFDLSFDGNNYTDFILFFETFCENHEEIFHYNNFLFLENLIKKNDEIESVMKEIQIIYNYNNYLLENMNDELNEYY
jgi:hypothetical protein